MRFLDFVRNETEHAIESLQALQIRAQIVEKDAGKGVARDLSKRRIAQRFMRLPRRGLLADELSDGDNQHSARAQMQRRRKRRDLPHRTVGVKVVANTRCRKDERYRARCEQMIDADDRAFSTSANSLPRLDRRRALKKIKVRPRPRSSLFPRTTLL